MQNYALPIWQSVPAGIGLLGRLTLASCVRSVADLLRAACCMLHAACCMRAACPWGVLSRNASLCGRGDLG